jgi:hypothetical protein
VRQELLDPLKNFPQYQVARKLVVRIHRLLGRGADYSEPLAELNRLAQKHLSPSEIEDAAELIDPKTYAYEVLADLVPTPTDLSYAEMLELVEQWGTSKDGIQAGHWSRCLAVNTGDNRVSTLLQSPELYFRHGVSRKMTAREILDTALAAGRKTRAEPPAAPDRGAK